MKTKEPLRLYCSFILPNFYYCNEVRHNCGKRNTTKIEKVNEWALRYVYDKHVSYQHLLERIRLPSIESRRIQDMSWAISDLINFHSLSTISSAKNVFYPYLKLTLPNMDPSYGNNLQPRKGMNYQMTLEQKQAPMKQ